LSIEYKKLEGSIDNWRIKPRKLAYIDIEWYDTVISFHFKEYLKKKGFANVVHNDPDTWVIQYSSESLTNYDEEHESDTETKSQYESESESYDSDSSCELFIMKQEFCITCKRNVLKKKHFENCPYCVLCKKYGHNTCIELCSYCNFCKLYGHSFNDCLTYKEYVKYIDKNMLRRVFGSLYNEYFHMYYKNYTSEKDGYEFVADLIPVYNYIQKKRKELKDLLLSNPLIKISNLLYLSDELSSKSMSYAAVLYNNDLLLIISDFCVHKKLIK